MSHILYERINSPADNQGSPCGYCAEDNNVIEANVYYTRDGEDLHESCCLNCVTDLVSDLHNGDDDVLVEVGTNVRVHIS